MFFSQILFSFQNEWELLPVLSLWVWTDPLQRNAQLALLLWNPNGRRETVSQFCCVNELKLSSQKPPWYQASIKVATKQHWFTLVPCLSISSPGSWKQLEKSPLKLPYSYCCRTLFLLSFCWGPRVNLARVALLNSVTKFFSSRNYFKIVNGPFQTEDKIKKLQCHRKSVLRLPVTRKNAISQLSGIFLEVSWISRQNVNCAMFFLKY